MTQKDFFYNYNSVRTRIFTGAIIIIMMINFNPLYSNDTAPIDGHSSMDLDSKEIITSSRAGESSRGSENIGPDSWITFMGNITHQDRKSVV